MDNPKLVIINDYFTEEEFSDNGRYFSACRNSNIIYDWNQYKLYEERETLSNLTEEEYGIYLNDSIAKGKEYFIVLVAYPFKYKNPEFVERLIRLQKDPLNLEHHIEKLVQEDRLFKCSWHAGKYNNNVYAAYYKISDNWQGPIIKPRIPLHPFVINYSPIFISEEEFREKVKTFGLKDEQIIQIINAKRKTSEMH